MPRKTVPVMLRIKGEKRRFHLPFERDRKELIMISSHPTKEDHVLVWRKRKEEFGEMDWHHVSAYEAKVTEKGIQEDPKKRVVSSIGDATPETPADTKVMDVFHVKVHPDLRGKGLGTAVREHMIAMGKNLETRGVYFPRTEDHPTEFYQERGFDKEHEARMEELDYCNREGLVDLSKKLEEKGFKVLWAKHRKYKD